MIGAFESVNEDQEECVLHGGQLGSAIVRRSKVMLHVGVVVGKKQG